MTKWHLQSLRYLVVGLTSNLVLFIAYLFLTINGVTPKLAMSLLFAMGALQTFILNKRWTFEHDGRLHASFIKYLTAYGCAYLLNLTALLVLVDNLRLPHQLVQGVMIISLALFLFLIQKYWVFR